MPVLSPQLVRARLRALLPQRDVVLEPAAPPVVPTPVVVQAQQQRTEVIFDDFAEGEDWGAASPPPISRSIPFSPQNVIHNHHHQPRLSDGSESLASSTDATMGGTASSSVPSLSTRRGDGGVSLGSTHESIDISPVGRTANVYGIDGKGGDARSGDWGSGGDDDSSGSGSESQSDASPPARRMTLAPPPPPQPPFLSKQITFASKNEVNNGRGAGGGQLGASERDHRNNNNNNNNINQIDGDSSTVTTISDIGPRPTAARVMREAVRRETYGRLVAAAVAERSSPPPIDSASLLLPASPKAQAAALHLSPLSPGLRKRRGVGNDNNIETPTPVIPLQNNVDNSIITAASVSASAASSSSNAVVGIVTRGRAPSIVTINDDASSVTASSTVSASIDLLVDHGNSVKIPASPPFLLSAPIPLFGVREGAAPQVPYRESTADNEDDYDFAIVVRAVVSPRQAASLVRAKAAAEARVVGAQAARDGGGGSALAFARAVSGTAAGAGAALARRLAVLASSALSPSGAKHFNADATWATGASAIASPPIMEKDKENLGATAPTICGPPPLLGATNAVEDGWYNEWDEEMSDGDDDGGDGEVKGIGEDEIEGREGGDKDEKQRKKPMTGGADDYDDDDEDGGGAAGIFMRGVMLAASSTLTTGASAAAAPPPKSAMFALSPGFLGNKTEVVPKATYACGEILAAIRAAGLEAARVRSLSRRTWLIKVRAPEWRLELEAEKVRLRMRRHDGGWSKYRRSLRAAFAIGGGCDGTSLFHSSDRQTLINHVLRSAMREGGADLGDNSPLAAFIDDMFPLHMKARLTELRSDLLAPWRPLRSTDEFDRVGAVRDSWYEPPVLIDVATVAANARAAAIVNHASNFSIPPNNDGGYEKDSGNGGVDDDKSVAETHAAKNRFRYCCCCGSAFTSKSLPKPIAAFLQWIMNLLIIRAIWTSVVVVQKMIRSTARLAKSIVSLPLDRIAAYFGETIAFQFAWTQFYTRWLLAPALAGIAVFIAQLWYGAVETPYSPLLTLAMAIWSMFFLAAWKRRTAELAARWGVLGYEAEEGLRPAFAGRWVANATTGEVSRVYSPTRRALTYAITVPATIAAVASLVAMLILVFSARDNVLSAYSRVAGVKSLRDAIASNPILAMRVIDGGDLAPLPPVPEPVNIGQVMRAAWAHGVSSFINAPPRAWRPTDGENTPFGFTTAQLAAADAAGLLAIVNAAVDRGVDNAARSGDSGGSVGGGISWSANQLGTLPALNMDAVHAYFTSSGDLYWWLAMTTPPLVLGIIMPILDACFSRIALVMNDAENHATESAYRNARIAKVFLFRFTAAFISLFWYAFSPSQSLIQLAVQLAVYLVFGQWWSLFLEAAIPAVRRRLADWALARRVRSAEDSGLTEGRRGRRLMRHALTTAWSEARLPRYDGFDVFSSALIQWGHVTFFAWAFPLAPAVALVFNVIVMRANAFKLVNSQRPIAAKASGIGIWFSVLEAMALAAVLVNCAQLALVSRAVGNYLPTGLSSSARLLLIFVVEHVVLALHLALPVLLPPTPERVRRRLARDDFALMKLQIGRVSLHQAAHEG